MSYLPAINVGTETAGGMTRQSVCLLELSGRAPPQSPNWRRSHSSPPTPKSHSLTLAAFCCCLAAPPILRQHWSRNLALCRKQLVSLHCSTTRRPEIHHAQPPSPSGHPLFSFFRYNPHQQTTRGAKWLADSLERPSIVSPPRNHTPLPPSEGLREATSEADTACSPGHVFGKSTRKDSCYDNIHISRNAWDTNLIKVRRSSFHEPPPPPPLAVPTLAT